jgi:hypothetical protein
MCSQLYVPLRENNELIYNLGAFVAIMARTGIFPEQPKGRQMTTAKMTTQQAARAFGVSTMTLYLWRQGTPTKDPLPSTKETKTEKPRIGYPISSARKWAKKHGIEFAVDPDKVVLEPSKKPGPVPRSKPKAGSSKRERAHPRH